MQKTTFNIKFYANCVEAISMLSSMLFGLHLQVKLNFQRLRLDLKLFWSGINIKPKLQNTFLKGQWLIRIRIAIEM